MLDECRGELLLWTGVGEPPVAEGLVEKARRFFPADRLALDVHSTTAGDAMAQEVALSIYRAWRRPGALVASMRARDADAADPATTRAVTEEEITAAILFETGGGWVDVWCVRVCRSDGRTARARLFPTSSVKRARRTRWRRFDITG